MRTYDDTFSGQKIYPGKVRFNPFSTTDMLRLQIGRDGGDDEDDDDDEPDHGTSGQRGYVPDCMD